MSLTHRSKTSDYTTNTGVVGNGISSSSSTTTKPYDSQTSSSSTTIAVGATDAASSSASSSSSSYIRNPQEQYRNQQQHVQYSDQHPNLTARKSSTVSTSTTSTPNNDYYRHHDTTTSKQYQPSSPTNHSNYAMMNGTTTMTPNNKDHPSQQVPRVKVKPLFRRTKSSVPPSTPLWVYCSIGIVILITIFTRPIPFQPELNQLPTIHHVFYYGWLTCVSTGLGAFPFYIFPDVATYWIGISNAIAAGMMVAASYSLFAEGCTYDDPDDTSTIRAEIRTALGAILGLVFILATKKFLDQYEDIKVGALGGTDARKALLIFFVMTLHSFSEGVGIGVSFGGVHGSELGVFISASLAVHNVPEGLAIAVSLIGRGLSITTAAIWAVATSLPQPLMAVPSYMFVHTFIPILPIGLGFAGGAMAWVAFFELLMEAIEDTNIITTILVSIPSCAIMIITQHALK